MYSKIMNQAVDKALKYLVIREITFFRLFQACFFFIDDFWIDSREITQKSFCSQNSRGSNRVGLFADFLNGNIDKILRILIFCFLYQLIKFWIFSS